jgi:protocatechuate 3,4-dioxygenase beta subunit
MIRLRVLAVASAATALVIPALAMGTSDSRQSARCAASPAQSEGPYYTPNPPLRTSFVAKNTPGTRLLLRGRVLDTNCRPVKNARVDFWQTDSKGVYDNAGFRFRGYQRTDAAGRYRLLTVVPGEYPGRTEHIHVKVTPPDGATLTSQLYFPNSDTNDGDGIYSSALLIRLTTSTTPWRGAFTFVVTR